MNHAVLTVYTPEEAAEVLRVGQSWLEQQAAARRVPFAMLGGCYRFTEDHLVQIVQIFESTPAPSPRVASVHDCLPVTERGGTRGTGSFAVNVVDRFGSSDSGSLALAAVAGPGDARGTAVNLEETNVPAGVDVSVDPIFVDSTGRRARNVRRVGYLLAGLCATCTAALGVSLTGVTPRAPGLVAPPAVASAAPSPSAARSPSPSSLHLQGNRSATANRPSPATQGSDRTRRSRSRAAPERPGPSPTAASSTTSRRGSFPSGSDGTDRPTSDQP